mmetsp:Transcript_568/g.1650  ORF Transcript_568/g.1650 Transcript_568/m.1650 type:complete len:108 (-) Transcript_568:628-951(-)
MSSMPSGPRDLAVNSLETVKCNARCSSFSVNLMGSHRMKRLRLLQQPIGQMSLILLYCDRVVWIVPPRTAKRKRVFSSVSDKTQAKLNFRIQLRWHGPESCKYIHAR